MLCSTVQTDWTAKPWASFSKGLRNQGPGPALMNSTGLNWGLVSLCILNTRLGNLCIMNPRYTLVSVSELYNVNFFTEFLLRIDDL